MKSDWNNARMDIFKPIYLDTQIGASSAESIAQLQASFGAVAAY